MHWSVAATMSKTWQGCMVRPDRRHCAEGHHGLATGRQLSLLHAKARRHADVGQMGVQGNHATRAPGVAALFCRRSGPTDPPPPEPHLASHPAVHRRLRRRASRPHPGDREQARRGQGGY